MKLHNITFDTKKRLHSPHQKIFHSEARFKVAGCGRRFGKSYLATYIIITKALQKQGNYFFVAPTFAQARQILWEILKDKTRESLALKINESRLEVELLNGSRIFLKGADRPDTMRGVSLCGVVLDEFATVREPEIVWQQVIRPALSDQKGWALFISSPAGRNYFYDLHNEAKVRNDWESWQFTTLDGGYVDDEEVESAKDDLDERSFRQEYLASFESFDGLVVPDYDRKLNNTEEEIKESDTLIFGIDFNVRKMACAVFIKRAHDLHLVDFFYGSFNTNELMISINNRYPKHKKIFHTDASGTANKSSSGGTTDIKIIENFGYNVYNLRKNPNIIDRVNAFNSMIKSTSGRRRVFVDNRLKRVVDTLEKHVFDDNGLPSKKHEYFDDVFDACFSGDTEVIVNNSLIKFKDIPPRGYIKGINGENIEFINGGVIRLDTLCDIKLSDGTIIKATPTHKFLTLNGWVSAHKLSGEVICDTKLYQNLNNHLMGCFTIRVRINIFIKLLTQKIKRVKASLGRASIELLMSITMGALKMGMLYIIKTIIELITTLKTLNLWKGVCIILFTLSNSIKRILTILGTLLTRTKTSVENGINQKMVIIGIKDIMKKWGIYFTKKYLLSVKYVGKKQKQQRVYLKGISTALINVVQGREEKAELMTSLELVSTAQKNLKLISTLRLRTVQEVVLQNQEKPKEKVYCVTVPNGNSFSLANGVIVHNCSYAVWFYSDYGKTKTTSYNRK